MGCIQYSHIVLFNSKYKSQYVQKLISVYNYIQHIITIDVKKVSFKSMVISIENDVMVLMVTFSMVISYNVYL